MYKKRQRKRKEYPKRSRIMHRIENLISLWSSSINNGVQGNIARENPLCKKRRKREKDSPSNSKKLHLVKKENILCLKKGICVLCAWDIILARFSPGLIYFQIDCQEQTRLRRLFSAKTKREETNRLKKLGKRRATSGNDEDHTHHVLQIIFLWRPYFLWWRWESIHPFIHVSLFSWIDVIPSPGKSFVSLYLFLSPCCFTPFREKWEVEKKWNDEKYDTRVGSWVKWKQESHFEAQTDENGSWRREFCGKKKKI